MNLFLEKKSVCIRTESIEMTSKWSMGGDTLKVILILHNAISKVDLGCMVIDVGGIVVGVGDVAVDGVIW